MFPCPISGNKELPELQAWVRWCYSCIGELRFGCHSVESSAGVQQGDPLGPLLFSLVVLDKIGQIDGIALSVWYLDDGNFIGKRSAILSFLDKVISIGPDFGLHLNLSKCEIFWPTGDQSFPEFPAEICRVLLNKNGVDLLGSPIFGSDVFFEDFVKSKVESILAMQSHPVDIDDPQVALHLLQSCLSLCKLNYLLRTVPPNAVAESCKLFDIGLRNSLETIIHSSLNDTSWLQATLPISLGGLGLRLASTSAPAAYIGSLNSTNVLVSLLLAGYMYSLQSSRE